MVEYFEKKNKQNENFIFNINYNFQMEHYSFIYYLTKLASKSGSIMESLTCFSRSYS